MKIFWRKKIKIFEQKKLKIFEQKKNEKFLKKISEAKIPEFWRKSKFLFFSDLPAILNEAIKPSLIDIESERAKAQKVAEYYTAILRNTELENADKMRGTLPICKHHKCIVEFFIDILFSNLNFWQFFSKFLLGNPNRYWYFS